MNHFCNHHMHLGGTNDVYIVHLMLRGKKIGLSHFNKLEMVLTQPAALPTQHLTLIPWLIHTDGCIYLNSDTEGQTLLIQNTEELTACWFPSDKWQIIGEPGHFKCRCVNCQSVWEQTNNGQNDLLKGGHRKSNVVSTFCGEIFSLSNSTGKWIVR